MVVHGGPHTAQGSCPAGMHPVLTFTVPQAGEGQPLHPLPCQVQADRYTPRVLCRDHVQFKRESPHNLPRLAGLTVSSTVPHLLCDNDSFTHGGISWWNRRMQKPHPSHIPPSPCVSGSQQRL